MKITKTLPDRNIQTATDNIEIQPCFLIHCVPENSDRNEIDTVFI